MKHIPSGSLFTISVGVYSDYTVTGIFMATEDLSPNDLRAYWLARYPEQAKEYHFEPHAFVADLVRRGLVEFIDGLEWHLTDYSTASEMEVLPAGVKNADA